MMTFTIGFTKHRAEDFFGRIRNNNIRRVVDVRLFNESQLAGFAKKQDLQFFLSELCNAEYIHLPELAPTKALLDMYKKHRGSWDIYARSYTNLLEQRRVETILSIDMFDHGCLLCSEHEPHYCHRRLAMEYLNDKWGHCLEVKHL